MGPYNTIDDIKQASNNSDEPKWFIPQFGTRVGSIVYGGRYFITSEKSKSRGATRRYTVRYCTDNGLIRNASDFQQYGTWSQANYAAIQFAHNQEAA